MSKTNLKKQAYENGNLRTVTGDFISSVVNLRHKVTNGIPVERHTQENTLRIYVREIHEILALMVLTAVCQDSQWIAKRSCGYT